MPPFSKQARIKKAYQVAPEEIYEPEMSRQDWNDFAHAVELFNRGKYWESHEAWELVWRRHPEPSRVFFQGLIQLAAAYHQLGRGIFHGVIKHMNNSRHKLQQFPEQFLGVDVAAIQERLEISLAEAQRLGEHYLDRFDRSQFAHIQFQKPRQNG